MTFKKGIPIIFYRECKHIYSSKTCWWGLFIAPILSLILVLAVMSEGLPLKIPISVVDLDNSSASRDLSRKLGAMSKIDIKFKDISFSDARKRMENGSIYGIFLIPKDFYKNAVLGNRPKITFYTNNSFIVAASLLFQDMKSMSILASAYVVLHIGKEKGYTEHQTMPIVQPIKINTHPIGNPWLSYSVYLNTAIIPAILQILILIFTIYALGSDMKNSNMKRLLSFSNNSILKLVVAKLLPYTIIFVSISLLIISVFFYYNKFPLQNGFIPIFLDYTIFIIAAQAMSVLIFAIFRHYAMSLNVAAFMGSLTFPIAGYSYPADGMNSIFLGLCNLFPIRHFWLIYVDQALNGSSILYSMPRFFYLFMFIVAGIISLPLLKKYFIYGKYER